MTYDVKNLRRAMRRYEEQIAAHESELNKRRQRIRQTIPRLGEIDRQLKSSVIGAIHTALLRGEDAEAHIMELKDENLELQREQAEILTMNGYPFNYLADMPMCDLCEDTGFIGNKMCQCLAKLYLEEQKRELMQHVDAEQMTFDHFSFAYYDDHMDAGIGASPKDNMGYIFDTCVDFAGSFGRHQDHLLLQGASGLGKTFLAASIANAVMEKGYSVLYVSASSLFPRIDAERFRNDEENSEMERYQNCDLFILDDLGTEALTNYGLMMLYQLLNTRKANKKQCIVVTSLTFEELRKRYGAQIASRLEGEYTLLFFFGADVRKKR